MSSPADGIRQHGTHNGLVKPDGVDPAALGELKLDAIIVPASRPAAHLDHAVTLARAANCWLLILCSQRVKRAEVAQFLTARSFSKAIVIDLPRGYSHELLSFPALRAVKEELPAACGFYVTDLSMKRNVGLVLARMLQWRRVFFLDDDIRDITRPDLQSTVNMLGSFDAAGMWVTEFPDNSIVCHANRMTEGSQDVFVSGAALAVDCDAEIGFFPNIYNEDWLFFFDAAARGRLANSGRQATQLLYYPFANARRAAWQEFGDVLAEGLYTLLHRGLGVEQATREYWTRFLEARRIFLEGVMTRMDQARPEFQADMTLSVQSALKWLLTIKPDLCERYIKAWRQDLRDWKQRAASITGMSIDEALREMRLSHVSYVGGTGEARPCREEKAGEAITAGPVAIPRFDTLKELSEHASSLRLSSAVPAAEKRQTIPLEVLTPERSAAFLARRAVRDSSLPAGPEEPARHWKQWLGSIPRLGSICGAGPLRFASAIFGPPPPSLPEHELAPREPEKTPCG
jgi:hypothetical protein